MRGKVIEEHARLEILRITPAHAGKSVKNIDKDLTSEDHPRTCGEKYVIVNFE